MTQIRIINAKEARRESELALQRGPDSIAIRRVMKEIEKAIKEAGKTSVCMSGLYLESHEVAYLKSLGYTVKYECEDRPCGDCYTTIGW